MLKLCLLLGKLLWVIGNGIKTVYNQISIKTLENPTEEVGNIITGISEDSSFINMSSETRN